VPGDAPDGAVPADDTYRVYFHGPAYQVLDRCWRDGDAVVGLLAADLPSDRVPPDAPTVTPPRLVELCFQTAGVRELGVDGVMALPMHVERLELGAAAPDAGPVHAVVRAGADRAVDAEVVGPDGAIVLRLTGYRTVPLPGGPGEDLLAPLQRAMA
jgi:hypothetical protein